MLENPLDPRYGVIAAASAAIGALALKLVDRAFQLRDRRDKDGVESRRELLEERIELRDRLRVAEDALAEWKEKYFKLLEESVLLKSHVVQLQEQTASLAERMEGPADTPPA
jgi:predicted nuclease with TOPRIM domain